MLRKNTDLRNLQADALGAVFDGGTLEIYTGTQPADPNSAPTGSLLATINIPNPAFGAAAAGVIAKAGTWSAVATDTGTAGWARFISASTNETFDVVVTEDPDDNDLLINTADITLGNTVTVISLTITVPES
jgi:hypothetical protein